MKSNDDPGYSKVPDHGGDYNKLPNAKDNGGNRLPGTQSQEGSYYVGMPSTEKYNRMNGIKAKRPGQNRMDFGPNDNYDDRL